MINPKTANLIKLYCVYVIWQPNCHFRCAPTTEPCRMLYTTVRVYGISIFNVVTTNHGNIQRPTVQLVWQCWRWQLGCRICKHNKSLLFWFWVCHVHRKPVVFERTLGWCRPGDGVTRNPNKKRESVPLILLCPDHHGQISHSFFGFSTIHYIFQHSYLFYLSTWYE